MTRSSWLALFVALVAFLGVSPTASAQPFAYVVGQRSTDGAAVVSVIDTTTNVRVQSIPLGLTCILCFNPNGIAIAPDVGRVYVTHEFAATVSVIDTASHVVVTTIAVGTSPTAIVASPDGTRVYVLNGSGATSVSEIDTATNAIVTAIPLGVLQARGMAITPDGARLYVTTLGSNTVKVIATDSMSVTATIPVGGLPLGIDVSPDGARVYVAAHFSNSVSVIDTTTDAVVATVAVESRPVSARVSPDGRWAYVANHDSHTVSVIDTQTNTVVENVQVGLEAQPRTLDFTPDGTRAYVANSSSVRVITTATRAVSGPIPFEVTTFGHPASIVIGRAVGGNAPTTVNERYIMNLSTSLNVPAPGVLANDNTDGGGAMTAVLVSPPVNGTLTLGPDGSLTYQPTPGFTGTDSFTYRAANNVGPGNVATVTLSVVSGPQPPTGLYASAVVGNTVTFRWMPPVAGSTPTGYVVEGGVSPGQVLASLPTGSTAPTFTVIAPTGAFYVRVHALSGVERSAASNEIRIFVNVPAVPSAPANLSGVVNGADLSLAWRNTFEGGTPTSLLLDVTGSINATLPLPQGDSFTFAGVPTGTYTLSLRAANATGSSGPSNSVILTFPGPCSGVPLTPTGVVAAKDGGLITVVWERATSGQAATGFVLNVTGSFVGSFPTTQRSLSGVVGPGTYTITVSANNVCGTSAPSIAQTVVIP
jgi:YVTN family beta-propeller protein